MYNHLDHDAVYKVHPEAVTFSDSCGAFDKNGTPIELDIQRIEEETEKLKETRKNDSIKYSRSQAYLKESDPLFFKYQAGEITKEEWLEKRQEIRERFPYL